MRSPADNAEEFYDRHSDDYVEKWERIDAEPERPAHVYRKQIIDTLLDIGDIRSGHRVVEIGCGTGLVLEEVLKRTAPVWGTDISIEMLRRAQSRLGADARVDIVESVDDAPPGADVYLMRDDIRDLHLRAGAFDRILSMEVLRYVEDLDGALANVRDAMAPDSLFTFTITNLWSASLFPAKFSLRRRLGRVDRENELLHFFVTERGLRRALARARLELVELRKLNLLTLNPLGRKVARTRRTAERLLAVDRALERVPLANSAFDTFVVGVKPAETS